MTMMSKAKHMLALNSLLDKVMRQYMINLIDGKKTAKEEKMIRYYIALINYSL